MMPVEISNALRLRKIELQEGEAITWACDGCHSKSNSELLQS